VTRLIRSKGVGVYYVTQSPSDVPDRVSAQLGNRVQHALRAFTPKEQKAIRAAADTFVKNPEFNTEQAIQQLKVGEALVSTLRNKGEPSMVQKALIRPPMARIGPLTREERRALIEADSENRSKYGEETVVEGAFERIEAMNSAMGNMSEKLTDVKEKLGGWFGIGRKDG
jgi:DNA helicase HerA-like ATPase